MSYEHLSGLDVAYLLKNGSALPKEPNIQDLPTPLPRTYREILRDIDPKIVDYAFLGTAIALKTLHVGFQKGMRAWHVTKKLLSSSKDSFLDGKSFAENNFVERVGKAFLDSYTPLDDIYDKQKLGSFENELLDNVMQTAKEAKQPKMTDEVFQTIKKMVDENEARRFKLQKDWKTPLLSDNDAKFLNGVAAEIEKYAKSANLAPPPGSSFRRSIFLSAAGAPIIDGLRFLPKDQIDKLRNLIDPEIIDPIRTQAKLGFLGDDD